MNLLCRTTKLDASCGKTFVPQLCIHLSNCIGETHGRHSEYAPSDQRHAYPRNDFTYVGGDWLLTNKSHYFKCNVGTLT